ncbi:ATP-binding cassette domain-containing protein [uncultured Cyclobacterium sp.]|uniref:ABC transporter ATP-binding protein n=1 Tax=uncultured Cyclobacterium sp. TaxID=453820 RepID=UPI0030ED583B|tara:strand:- start:30988 stop:31665 length:678 start_codon:yes stop_codon:yes gene_type:complete
MIDLSLKKALTGAEGKIALDLSCQIQPGELVGLYGPSGAGKSSVLRMIAGLMHPDHGLLVVGNETWIDTGNNFFLKPEKRNIGMVFQEYSIFPNMTVYENLVFALDKGQNKSFVDELLHSIGMEKMAGQSPMKLSGGQKQRVALARAMVRKPKVLLLDEPLSALDMEMRRNLQEYIVKFHREYGLTTLLVSHDASEISRMAQRVLVLENGQFSFDGTPASFFKTS